MSSLESGTCATPFDVLGIHPLRGPSEPGRVVRAFIPWARSISVLPTAAPGTPPVSMTRMGETGAFEARFPSEPSFFPYRLQVTDRQGTQWTLEDPYRFGPVVDEARVHAFLNGTERRVHRVLGSSVVTHHEVRGTRFGVWAPHAHAVSVMGDMNGWDGRCHPMRPRGATGVWELFIPGVEAEARYKYRIVTRHGQVFEKADPCGRAMELRPATASEVWPSDEFTWNDDEWMSRRGSLHSDGSPISIYEVHPGSWRRQADRGAPGWPTYEELADELLPYVAGLGFTHVELLPVMEHPLDESWGYQPLGFFAPTSRYGTPDDLRRFVDRAHRMGIGVILDWVPGHFPADAHGLARFDGTALYEHPDPVQARHPDWGTLIFDYGTPAVRSFLTSSAIHWLEDYHVDGLRVDAVASMLYLDYSRAPGEWSPNEYGGNEDLHAVEFLRGLNDAVHEECPGALMIAEESTSWPRVSHGTDRNGLGFDRKWNMGWMNDTLRVFEADPLFRKSLYDRLTFSQLYAYSERFVLPLSHDEVVHGKRSLLSKMPGSDSDRFANLRALLAYQWAHPGDKLVFMGAELAQWTEWAVDDQLDWALLDIGTHAGVSRLVSDLNRLYRSKSALHELDFRPEGFEWLECHDADRTTLAFLRWSREWTESVLVAINLTPVHLAEYQLPVPFPGSYRVLLNTDAPDYGGSGALVPPSLEAKPGEIAGRSHHLTLPLPGLSVLFLERSSD